MARSPTKNRASKPLDLPSATRPGQLLEFATKHYVVFSTLLITVGILSATVFLYGYLSVFDWRLIWIIEYTDVLKVGLVAIAILSGLSASISPIVDNAFVATEYEQPKSAEEVPAFLKLRRNKMLQGVAIIVASLAVFLALTYFFGGQNYLLLVLLHVSASMIFFLVLLGIERSRGIFVFSARQLLADCFFVVLCVYTLGATFGQLSKAGPNFNSRRVYR